MVNYVIIEPQRQLLERVVLGARQFVVFKHLHKNHIAALQGLLGPAQWVEQCRIFSHSGQHCRLLNTQFLRGGVEVNSRRRFNAHSLIHKIELIEIHCNNLFFGVAALELDGDNPLTEFSIRHFKRGR